MLLKKEVEIINAKLEAQEITIEESKILKREAAKNRALNIENESAIIDNRIALLERNNSKKRLVITLDMGGEKADSKDEKKERKKEKYDIRTSSTFVLAAGFNNALSSGQSINDSDYRVGGSRFFEFGGNLRTRIFKNSNFLRLIYGISYQSNGLKPTGNRFFFVLDLDKSKLRLDHLVVPIHFEFGPSNVSKTDEKIRYNIEKKLKIGIGGYAGFRINTIQKLKYKDGGERIKDRIKRDYNTSDITYGLSGYLGIGSTSLYLKYDLSPIFKNAIKKQNNISLGVRFDL